MTEQWVPVPVAGYQDLYSISDEARVRSERTGQILRGSKNNGYPVIQLCRDGVNVKKYVHALMLEAFVGPRPDGMETLHWDDNRQNPSLGNLRFGSSADNKRDAVRNGTHFQSRKTHCKRGHEFTPENTLPNGRDGKGRQCRTCDRLRRKTKKPNGLQLNQLNTAAETQP